MGIIKRVKFNNVDAAPRQMVTLSSSYVAGLKSYYLYNPNSTDVFVKFYDETSGTCTVGVTATHYGAILVPANAQVFENSDGGESNPLMNFDSGVITVAATTEEPDTGTTSPSLDITVELIYWGI